MWKQPKRQGQEDVWFKRTSCQLFELERLSSEERVPHSGLILQSVRVMKAAINIGYVRGKLGCMRYLLVVSA